MDVLVIDIETKKSFGEIGSRDPAQLGVSYVGVYSYVDDNLFGFFEKELDDFWPILSRADLVIGYNIDGFDLPSLKNYYPGHLNQIKTLDLMKVIRQATGIRLGLDAVAQATLGKGKIGHGLDAIRYYHEKRWQELAKYCLEDVKITKELHDYMAKFRSVSYKDISGHNIITVPVEMPQIRLPSAKQTTLF